MQNARANGLAELLMKIREDRAVGRPPTIKSKNPWKTRKVEFTPEFERIAGIPSRDWESEADGLAEALTELLKLPGGTQKLYPIQAYVLRELYVVGGAIAIVRVGGGKSLITFLAPYVMNTERALLVVPGSLVEKTQRHMNRDRYHWKIPGYIRVESYEKLAKPENQNLLYEYRPTLVMLDEGSRVKNAKAVVTKQIGYYLKDCKRGYYKQRQGDEVLKIPLHVIVKVLVLSGTLTVRSIKDYWHILRWVLPDPMVPLPLLFSELEQWALALDSKVGELHRVKPGALLELCSPEELEIAKKNPLKAARQAYRRRFLSTPGVVSTSTPFLGCSLLVKPARVKVPQEVQDAFTLLRKKWKTPDDYYIEDGKVAAQHAKWYSLGYYQRLNPRPPIDYLTAKKTWAQGCRYVLSRNRQRLDSAGQVILAMEEEGLFPDLYKDYLEWVKWDKKFTPKVEHVWISDYAVNFAATWMKKKENKRGIVWCTDPAFAIKLSQRTGVAYYRDEGLDKNGRFIEDHPHNTPMIASLKANYIGKNLQYGWSRNLLMGSIGSGEMMEQWLGRTHRDGQTDDLVTAELFWSCIEHAQAIWSAIEDHEFADDMETARKLMYADVVIPPLESLSSNSGVLWKEGDLDAGLAA